MIGGEHSPTSPSPRGSPNPPSPGSGHQARSASSARDPARAGLGRLRRLDQGDVRLLLARGDPVQRRRPRLSGEGDGQLFGQIAVRGAVSSVSSTSIVSPPCRPVALRLSELNAIERPRAHRGERAAIGVSVDHHVDERLSAAAELAREPRRHEETPRELRPAQRHDVPIMSASLPRISRNYVEAELRLRTTPCGPGQPTGTRVRRRARAPGSPATTGREQRERGVRISRAVPDAGSPRSRTGRLASSATGRCRRSGARHPEPEGRSHQHQREEPENEQRHDRRRRPATAPTPASRRAAILGAGPAPR